MNGIGWAEFQIWAIAVCLFLGTVALLVVHWKAR